MTENNKHHDGPLGLLKATLAARETAITNQVKEIDRATRYLAELQGNAEELRLAIAKLETSN